MYSIIAGTILLALVHALIPNHWLPLVAVGKAEKWEKSELMLVSYPLLQHQPMCWVQSFSE
ncbi:MAG: hypothetical protein J0I09_03065 [Sphingobacteriia bacterium]|nr:hypothetical protein [Sphingobacteriia bacterium]